MHVPLWTHLKREPHATIAAQFVEVPRAHRDALERIPGSPHVAADAAACLLGIDLWRGPLLGFRDYLAATGERPHLWTFASGPSGAWDANRWKTLTLSARLLRSRVGSLDRSICARSTAWSLSMESGAFRSGLASLLRAGFAKLGDGGVCYFDALATPDALRVDLALIEIIAHWLWRLSDRERVLADPHATGYEVHGFEECCALCRSRWGLRERNERWVPPFHPGCRCFAQPRFA